MAILPSTRSYRNSLHILLYKAENVWGRENNLVRNHGYLMGLTENWTFPDTEMDWQTYRHVRPTGYMPASIATPSAGTQPGAARGGTFYTGSVGTPSVGNWVAIYDGVKKCVGSIPDIKLLSGHILPFIFGAASNEAAESINGVNYFTHHVMQRIELPSFTLEGVLFNTSGDDDHVLVRRARGCKVNRATISANEGEQLKVSLDEIVAKGTRHNMSGVAGDAEEREYLGYHSNLDWPNSLSSNPNTTGANQPLDVLMGALGGSGRANLDGYDIYKFSEGRIELLRPDSTNSPDLPAGDDDSSPSRNTNLARIRSFRLSVNNNITPQHWINDLNRKAEANISGNNINELADDDPDAVLLGQMLPTGLVEGHKELELEIVAAVSDPYFYERFMSEGRFGREKRGFGIRLRFTRQILGSTANAFATYGNEADYMEIRMPGDVSGNLTNTRRWGASFTYPGSGPIGGMGTQNTNIGCFFASAPIPIQSATSEALVYMTMRVLVPSADIVCRDRFSDYLSSGVET